LIFLEPDWGTALLLATVSSIMLLVAGVRWRHFFPPFMIGAATFMIFLLNNPVRMKRILSWMNPEQTKEGVGYQAWQATLALGSGGWTGLGLGNGRQKFGYLPEHQTDFILANIGEELGLIATLGVVAAFVVLLICGIYIAWHSRDTFGLLLATGLTFLIALQAFINIGVVTSALPNKGLPLPFISRGGSNLFLMLVCVGLLLSVARRAADPFSSLCVFGIAGLLFTHIVENVGMTVNLLPITGIPLPFFSYGGSFMLTCALAVGIALRVARESRQSGYAES